MLYVFHQPHMAPIISIKAGAILLLFNSKSLKIGFFKTFYTFKPKKAQIIMNTPLQQRAANGSIDHGQVGFGDGGVSQEDAAGDHDGDDEVAFPGLEGEQADFIVHGCNAVDVLFGQVGELNFVCPNGKAYAEDA